jgi:hypothetical protein
MDPLCAHPLSGNSGFTWTIASRISDALHTAENLYGERDKSYFLAGFEFGTTIPRLWYPGDRKHIVIQLSPEAKASFPQAIFQIAHEVIHLLSPTGGAHANILEEGLAEHFSESYASAATGTPWHPTTAAYTVARDLVRKLLAFDSDAVRKIRKHEPCMSNFTPEVILAHVSGVPKELADRLCVPFIRA